MNNNLRTIVRRHIQEKSLGDFLGDKYETTPEEMKDNYLRAVEDSVEREVDSILSEFIEDTRKGSSESRKRKKRSYLVLAVTVICTTGITITVDQENWIVSVILMLALLGVQIYNISEEY